MSPEEKETEDKSPVADVPASDIPEPPTLSEAPKASEAEATVTTEPPLVSEPVKAADVPAPTPAPAAATAVAIDAKPIGPPPVPKERRSRWESSFVALRYLSGIGRDTQIKVRDSDRATSFSLLIVAFLTLVSLFVPGLADFRFNLLAVCDVLAGVSVVFYIANRFGILSTLPPRAALLCWQLMLGAWFIGMYVTINVVLIGFINQHLPSVPDTQPVHVVTPATSPAVPAPPTYPTVPTSSMPTSTTPSVPQK
jgi:hypothetical protein